MEVEIVESSLVVPSEETPNRTIWLSNLDLMFSSRMHTPVILFYRPNGDPNFFSLEILKPALAKALVHFYPLAGRLGVAGDGRLEIKCTGEGVLLVVARCGATMDAVLRNFTPSKEVKQLLLPPADSSERRNMGIMLQVTFFACGAVCLGNAINHGVMDGTSSFHFLNTWAAIARGAEGDVELPSLDRTPLRARLPPTVAFDHYEYKHHPKSDKNPNQLTSTSSKVLTIASASINLSEYQIASLKHSIGGQTRRVSTFAAVTALAWRCACRARKLDPDQEMRLFMAVDSRNRRNPPVNPRYFGNAAIRTSVGAAAGAIASRPLLSSVEAIGDAVARIDEEYTRSIMDLLEQMDDIVGMGLGPWRQTRDLWAVSWLTLPVQDANFGWGRPVFLGRAQLAVCGGIYLSRNLVSDGGVTLLMTMEQENIGEFLKLFHQELAARGKL